jgi:hypothetical protein
MNHSNLQFTDAVRIYPDFKILFKQFCEVMAKRLNGNEQLPGVKFSVEEDGVCATLQALDCTFDISFRFAIVDTTPRGLLRVSIPGEDKTKVQLFQYLFDKIGNVFIAPDASASLHSVTSDEFVKAFINRVASEHLLRVWHFPK